MIIEIKQLFWILTAWITLSLSQTIGTLAAKATCRRDSDQPSFDPTSTTLRYICHQNHVRHTISYRPDVWIHVTSFITSSVLSSCFGDSTKLAGKPKSATQVSSMTKVYLTRISSTRTDLSLLEETWSLDLSNSPARELQGRLYKMIPSRNSRHKYPCINAQFTLSHPYHLLIQSKVFGDTMVLKVTPEHLPRAFGLSSENTHPSSRLSYSVTWDEAILPFDIAISMLIMLIENAWKSPRSGFEYPFFSRESSVSIPLSEEFYIQPDQSPPSNSGKTRKLGKSVSWHPHVQPHIPSSPERHVEELPKPDVPSVTHVITTPAVPAVTERKSDFLARVYARKFRSVSSPIVNPGTRVSLDIPKAPKSPVAVSRPPVPVRRKPTSPTKKYPTHGSEQEYSPLIVLPFWKKTYGA